MAVMMVMAWPGATPEQYDQLRQLVNWEGAVPAGGLFHVAAFDAQGARIVDVWESADAFQTFTEQRLLPAVQQLGLPGEPRVEVFPVHALFTPGYTPTTTAPAIQDAATMQLE